MVRPLARHVPLRDPPQLAVDERDQLLDRTGIATPPVNEKGRYIVSPEFRQSVLRDC
jgi:hypothetical protein